MKRFGVAIAALLLLLTGTPARALDPIKLTVTPNVLNIDGGAAAPADRYAGSCARSHQADRNAERAQYRRLL